MDKNIKILQPNRKTTNRKIRGEELIRLRLYSIELNRIVAAQLALANQHKGDIIVSECVPNTANGSDNE